MIPLWVKQLRAGGIIIGILLFILGKHVEGLGQDRPVGEGDNPIDVGYYHLTLKIDPDLKRLGGSTTMTFRCTRRCQGIWVNLDESFQLAKVLYGRKGLTHQKVGQRRYIKFPRALSANSQHTLHLYFGGAPTEGEHIPGAGGFLWERDPEGLAWVVGATREQASWWPFVSQDPVDSMKVTLMIPAPLRAISPGTFVQSQTLPGNFKEYEWRVTSQMLPERMAIFLGDFLRMSDTHVGDTYNLPLNYYILSGKEDQTRQEFTHIKEGLNFLDQWIGVQAEHGKGLSFVMAPGPAMAYEGICTRTVNIDATPSGMNRTLFQQLVRLRIHTLCSAAPQDRWLSEALSGYFLSLYLETKEGPEAFRRFMDAQRRQIQSLVPIGREIEPGQPIPPAVRAKGIWLFHTLRQGVGDDAQWKVFVKQLGQLYPPGELGREQLAASMGRYLRLPARPILNQYLDGTSLPVFEYRFVRKGKKSSLEYRWVATSSDFSLPISIRLSGQTHRLIPTSNWQELAHNVRTRDRLEVVQEGLFEVREVF